MNGRTDAAIALDEKSGLFSFESEAHSRLDEFFESLSSDDPHRTDLVRSLCELSAAELALNPHYVDLDREVLTPIVVDDQSAQLAVLKSDTAIMGGCWQRVDLYPLPEDEPAPLWDVTMYSADISKLVAGPLAHERLTLDNVEVVVERLEDAYIKSGVPIANALVRSQLVRFQGLVWAAKLAVLHGEDVYDQVERTGARWGLAGAVAGSPG